MYRDAAHIIVVATVIVELILTVCYTKQTSFVNFASSSP